MEAAFRTHVEFRSDAFPSRPGEAEPINSRRWGAALVDYLKPDLTARPEARFPVHRGPGIRDRVGESGVSAVDKFAISDGGLNARWDVPAAWHGRIVDHIVLVEPVAPLSNARTAIVNGLFTDRQEGRSNCRGFQVQGKDVRRPLGRGQGSEA